MKPFIGIKNIWYGSVLTKEPTVAGLLALIQTMTQVKNSHDGTWGYSQDDPETTDYKNELTGLVYYTDKTSDGAQTINFTMGAYEFADKAELQGGQEIKESSESVGWKSTTGADLVHKAIVAQTKTGHYIIFSNAAIVAKADVQEKNIGLGVKAVAMESDTDGVSAIYFFNGDKVAG